MCLILEDVLHYFLDVDDCADHKCKNNGICMDLVNGYACACVVGFAGKTCETGLIFRGLFCSIMKFEKSF